MEKYLEIKGKLGSAIAIAAEQFIGKYDKSGEPYILHCLAVMENVKKYEEDELMIAAVLHDIVEDTKITLYDLEHLYGFTKRVCKMISDVTFKKGCTDEEYMAQILRICDSQDSIRLKMADLEHNSLILRLKGINEKDQARMKKYHTAYYILRAHLITKR